ncbi:hypothetical protein KIW84_056710 [Lathyrus oleraceus]|uniref:Retrovirus-related Pol polyprotein from transposon TNT 1-94-like beta-barrel domain-containing protein n=1 Tax=Pisum sativum TaxID=3888 RepID=A0A9D5AMX8_PEA|nr:hypothetical protein KIW84_056710 [Pisum sativum]
MTGQKVWLADFDESKKSKVKLNDNSLLQAEGTNDIVIQMSNGGKAMIKDVLHEPKMKYNLLSVGQLVEKGFLVVMKYRTLELFDTQNNLVLKYHLSKNRTFKTMIILTENYGDPINKPLMSYDVDEEADKVEVEAIADIPVEVIGDIPDTIKVEKGMASTSQRPQRNKVRPLRLQDYEVTSDDEVKPDG